MSAPGADASLAGRLAAELAAALRQEGLAVPLSATLGYAGALLALGSLERTGLYWAGRAVFVRGPEQIGAYDRAFARYFAGGAAPSPLVVTPSEPPAASETDTDAPGLGEGPGEVLVAFSPTERLGRGELARLSAREAAEVAAAIGELGAAPSTLAARRLVRDPHGAGRLDLRRSVAGALRTDGELLERRYRHRAHRTRRLVLLCDVSGSMGPYARAYLMTGHVLVRARTRVEVFALGTRLTRLTRALASRDPDRALEQAGAEIADWSGGTRLGETLGEFNDRFGLRAAARAATVLICSDGIDRGDPELVAEQMGRLARVAHRVIWVNPLKATPGYAPLARGMAAALPFVDEFVPGDSLASLRALVGGLQA